MKYSGTLSLGNELRELERYELTPESIVWIVGAFKGTTALILQEMYDQYIHAFDPQDHAIQMLSAIDNPKLSIHPFGLGDREARLPMREVGNDACTFFGQALGRFDGMARDVGTGRMRNALAIYEELRGPIDLMLLNCEGGEWLILPNMASVLSEIRYLLVQFHRGSIEGRSYHDVRRLIGNTHRVAWDQGPSWVSWENRAWPPSSGPSSAK